MEHYAGRNFGTTNMYRVGPFFILEYSDSMYILDSSKVQQVRLSLKFWAGMCAYITNYRMCADKNACENRGLPFIHSIFDWVSSALKRVLTRGTFRELCRLVWQDYKLFSASMQTS